ncbi:MAG: hypothetical protein AAB927_01380 [Patescibacteria group bacterium]
MPQMRFDITGIVIPQEKERVIKRIRETFQAVTLDFNGVRAEKIDVMVTNPAGEFADIERSLRNILSECGFARCKILPAVVPINGKAPIL